MASLSGVNLLLKVSRGLLLFPIEVSSRELEAKLLLAAEAANRGILVVIGHKESVNRFAYSGAGEGSVYFSKAVPRRDLDQIFEVLLRRKLVSVAQDEEAGLQYEHFADFARQRPSLGEAGDLRAYFCWGDDEFNHLQSTGPKVREQQDSGLMLTGSARAALWGPLGKSYFSDEILALRKKYGNYTLVVTSLASANHILGAAAYERMVAKNADSFRTFSSSSHRRDVEREIELSGAFREMVRNLSSDRRADVVIRPHPDENPRAWVDFAAEFSNVHVEASGDITPLVLAARAVIHSSSSVALAAYSNVDFLISFLPGKNIHTKNFLANRISSIARSVSDVLRLLQDGRNGYVSSEKSRMVARRLKGRGSIENIHHVVDAIELISAPSHKKIKLRVSLRFFLARTHLLRIIAKSIPNALLPSQAKVGLRKRPNLRDRNLKLKLKRASLVLGHHESGLKVKTYGGSLAVVTANPAVDKFVGGD